MSDQPTNEPTTEPRPEGTELAERVAQGNEGNEGRREDDQPKQEDQNEPEQSGLGGLIHDAEGNPPGNAEDDGNSEDTSE